MSAYQDDQKLYDDNEDAECDPTDPGDACAIKYPYKNTFCSRQGMCVDCILDSDCTRRSDNLNHCSMGHCTECIYGARGSNKQCASIYDDKKVCNHYGECVECIKGEDESACIKKRMICTDRGTCAECDYFNGNDDCNEGYICTRLGICSKCCHENLTDCEDDNDCEDGFKCTEEKKCSTCSDDKCYPKKCDSVSRKCVNCLSDKDCNFLNQCHNGGDCKVNVGNLIWFILFIIVVVILLIWLVAIPANKINRVVI
jgi:hypothetical protein